MEGDRTLCVCACLRIVFQSTPSAWRETVRSSTQWKLSNISIHSLRMEGDCRFPSNNYRKEVISIHSLRMEGDTIRWDMKNAIGEHFNPLPPHGGRQTAFSRLLPTVTISIHSLRMEGDPFVDIIHACRNVFQSTPSAWRETVLDSGSVDAYVFQSTPSAWRETKIIKHNHHLTGHFNPLPPHGGRPTTFISKTSPLYVFQSTPSAWRETRQDRYKSNGNPFQSTPSAWRETFLNQ